MAKRSITDEEIGLIKAMLARSMANKAIASATYNAPSRHSGGAPSSAAPMPTVSVVKLMVIACSCSAM